MRTVCIVGAGPAGVAAALECEKLGIDYLLLDRASFPRPKPCGGVLPWRVLELLELPEELIESPLRGYRIHSRSCTAESLFPSPGASVSRHRLDAHLASLPERPPRKLRVSGIKEREDCVLVLGEGQRIRAEYVIGADGANSSVRKSMGIPYRRFASACQYLIELEHVRESVGEWFEVYYLFTRGYGWLVPLRGAVRAGVGGLGFSRRELESFLHMPEVAEKLAGGRILAYEAHRIPMQGPAERLASRRALLCGDAGGFVYPGTGEGIYYALLSGAAAARAVASAAAGEPLEQAYSRECSHLEHLRHVDFLDSVLGSQERTERYVRRLSKLRTRF
ncbi:MAG: NAD(P)/FAD-dependent oxidoreductase [Euryarchaeota archaeon]|nr:NAD(P)/FAD-dependent oxidoreductase [Euryarchaeota archaeon]